MIVEVCLVEIYEVSLGRRNGFAEAWHSFLYYWRHTTLLRGIEVGILVKSSFAPWESQNEFPLTSVKQIRVGIWHYSEKKEKIEFMRLSRIYTSSVPMPETFSDTDYFWLGKRQGIKNEVLYHCFEWADFWSRLMHFMTCFLCHTSSYTSYPSLYIQ